MTGDFCSRASWWEKELRDGLQWHRLWPLLLWHSVCDRNVHRHSVRTSSSRAQSYVVSGEPSGPPASCSSTRTQSYLFWDHDYNPFVPRSSVLRWHGPRDIFHPRVSVACQPSNGQRKSPDSQLLSTWRGMSQMGRASSLDTGRRISPLIN